MKITPVQKIIIAIGGLLIFSKITANASTSPSPNPYPPGSGPADKDYRKTPNLPRGIRNNNPGNQKRTTIDWQGKIPFKDSTDETFEQFYVYKFGIRAMIKDLQNDYRVDKKKTMRGLITVYAPRSENNTAKYIADVAKWTGINPDAILPDTKSTWKTLCIAMARRENGPVNSITSAQFDQVWSEFFA